MSMAALIAQRKREQPKWADEEFTDWIVAKQQVSPEVTQYITSSRLPWREIAPASSARRCSSPPMWLMARLSRRRSLRKAVKLMPKGRAVHIAGAGHNIRREQFDAYMTAVREFLAELG